MYVCTDVCTETIWKTPTVYMTIYSMTFPYLSIPYTNGTFETCHERTKFSTNVRYVILTQDFVK
eukprot:SAG11_NODE_25844_length_353_cov_0.791339_1_plen_63_part_10